MHADSSTAFQTPSWTRLSTPTGRYEYQFHGHTPAVRAGAYLSARDYLFLVMDEDRWLYRIPVQLTDDVAPALTAAGLPAESADLARLAESRLCSGLQSCRPRQNAPYEELDSHFRLDSALALILARA